MSCGAGSKSSPMRCARSEVSPGTEVATRGQGPVPGRVNKSRVAHMWRVSPRNAISILLGPIASLLISCGGGGGGGGSGGNGPPHVNQPPVAADDILRADGSALDSIGVLANDHDPDGDT